MKRSSKKGFTLAELLIVIAIIAILVAIMFPVFGTQLNKARAAAELANVRAKYAELVADEMLKVENATIEEDWGVTINIGDLGEALQYKGSKITVTAGAPASGTGASATPETKGKIEVEYKTYSGSFATDGDVTISGSSSFTKG